jgi:AcrR family transcriptional regulator
MVKKLLDTAARILVRDGYAGINTNAIADAAGISVGSLYQYFPSKDALVAAVHERHATSTRAQFDEFLANHSSHSLEDAIGAWVHTLHEAYRSDLRLHRALDSEVPHLMSIRARSSRNESARTALAKVIQAHRSQIKSRDLPLTIRVATEIACTLAQLSASESPRKTNAAAVERETVHAVIGYLTNGRSKGRIKPA